MPVQGFLNVSAITPRIQGDRGADRGFIAGRSGAGKSFLARRLLTTYGIGDSTPREFRANGVIIDPNGNFDFPSERIVHTVEDVKLDKKIRWIRYIPDSDQLTAEHWNELWRKCFYYKHPLIVYSDETRAMEPLFGRVRFPSGNNLIAYLTRGRALGKAAIMGAQRPVTIPRDIIGQAEWFYIFDLPLEDDRITIAGTIGSLSEDGERIKDVDALHGHEFWLKTPALRKPVKAEVIK